MEKNAQNSIFESPAIVERGRFGKTGVPLFWVEKDGLVELAGALRADPELALDWLENFSVMQLEGMLVTSWFLRSRATPARLVLRSTVTPSGSDEVAELPSVCEVWPEAEPQEREASELFGIRFGGRPIPRRLLPQGFAGFPLRKSFNSKAALSRDSGLGGFLSRTEAFFNQ